MIVVIDTNVIVSSLLSPNSPPAEIMGRWDEGDFELAISLPLLAELRRALNYPQVKKYFKRPQGRLRTLIEGFKKIAIIVDPQLSIEVIEKDPDDNRVLECAVASDASYIVTGDTHLLKLKEYKRIVILNPVSFAQV